MINSEKKIGNSHRMLIGIIAIMLGLTPLICRSPIYYDFSNLPQSAYLQTISVIILILFFLNGYFNKQLIIKTSCFYIPIFGILIWSFLSLFWCTNVPEGLTIWLNWFAGAIIFFVIFNLIRDNTDIKIMFVSITLPTIFIIFVGINQYLETTLFNYSQIVSPAVTFGNKNMMIDALIPMLPISLYLSFQSFFTNIIIKIMGNVIYGAGIVIIVLSDTRSGMLAVAIQLMLYSVASIYLNKKSNNIPIAKYHVLLINASSLIITFILFFSVVNYKNELNLNRGVGNVISGHNIAERIKSIFKTAEEDKWAFEKGNKDIALKAISDSRNMRLVTWQNSLVMFSKKPIFGFGIFNWQIHYGEFRNIYLNDPVYRPGMAMIEVHNDYLQLIVDLGLPAGILALILLYFNGQTIWRIMRQGTLEDKEIVIVVGLGLIGLYLVAFFSFPFERSVPVMMFFLYCAFLAYLRNKNSATVPRENLMLGTKFSFSFTVLMIVILIGILYIQNRRMSAELEFKAAQDQHGTGNYEISIKHAKRALELNPYRYTSYFLLGYSQLCVNDLKSAETSLLKGLEKYPNDLNSLLQISTTYTKLAMQKFAKYGYENQEVREEIQKANKWFDKTLSIRDDFYTIYFNKGVLHWQQYVYARAAKEKEKAIEHQKLAIENYVKSINLNPFYIDGLTTLAQLMYEIDNKKDSIIYAERAVKILISDFEKTENEISKLEEAKIDRASRVYVECTRNRRRSRQMLISSIYKVLPLLKNYYGSIEVNYEKYLEVVLNEEKYFFAKEIELQEQLNFADEVLKRNEGKELNDTEIYKVLRKEFDDRLFELEDFKIESQMATAMLNLDKGEVYQGMKKYNLALQAFSKVIQIANINISSIKEAYINKLKSYSDSAHLSIADIFTILSTYDNANQQFNIDKFMEYSPTIESHLNSIKINESDKLYRKYMVVSTKYIKYKEMANSAKNKK